MKILSFDVGVKNLAGIVLDIDDNYLDSIIKNRKLSKKEKNKTEQITNEETTEETKTEETKTEETKTEEIKTEETKTEETKTEETKTEETTEETAENTNKKAQYNNMDFKKININSWEIINLLEPNSESSLCNFININKSINFNVEDNNITLSDNLCGKNASYVITNKNKELCLCTKHKTFMTKVIKEIKYTKLEKEEQKNLKENKTECCFNGSKDECNKTLSYKFDINDDNNIYNLIKEDYNIFTSNDTTNTTNTTNNNYLCSNHQKKIKKIFNIKSVKTTNFNNIPIDDIKYNLWILLDKKPELLDVNYVIIENQPVLRNPRMKTISETLYNYFLCRGIIDKTRTNSIIEKVRYISPSNKLKVDADNSLNVLRGKNKTEKYKLTKSLAVQYTKQIVNNYPNYIDMFKEAKKKDDLADCLLQGLYYIYYLHG